MMSSLMKEIIHTNPTRRNWGEGLTGIQIRRDNVEHSSVHVGMNDPIAGCIIAGSNEDGISLSDSDTNKVYR